jgi:hypothetical protein
MQENPTQNHLCPHSASNLYKYSPNFRSKSSNNSATQIIRNHHLLHFRVFEQIGVFESEVGAKVLGYSRA